MMDSSELAELCQQINDKIFATRTILELRTVANEEDKQNILVKMGKDIFAINGLLDTLETHVFQQQDLLNGLKELEEFFQEDLHDGYHLRDNMPLHMPRKGLQTANTLTQSQQDQVHHVEEQNLQKKPTRPQIREMVYITTEEFESIPQYMKGRMTYSQLNAAVQSINTAVKEKYSIVQQPAKTLTNVTRRLHQRFKDEETKDTKGHFFVVEADIQEFTQLKLDKRFKGMLSMLRHCHRLRELRGAGLTRYILL
ncbi:spindle and kinetochore-associated protein 1 [Conger conger]|uniref:spindle and kinetochore-associated protein 1 n=1 Tax=Conger conger TaxID=82655 RepID=UPI002A5AF44F|nr:spindle and kinetochore-associated protein 1 [Conger conger]